MVEAGLQDRKFSDILRKYSGGLISAADAVYEIQEMPEERRRSTQLVAKAFGDPIFGQGGNHASHA
jgi:hypothetical protein